MRNSVIKTSTENGERRRSSRPLVRGTIDVTLLNNIKRYRAELVGVLATRFLIQQDRLDQFLFEEDGPLAVAGSVTGLTLTEAESDAVFGLLEVVSREALLKAGLQRHGNAGFHA